ncbi:uncharacterized protein STAUR_7546 [Stigmatella aurantiaca DW4/3-1]|nr:uncharacterized protein STAUR_7546 [Stigmatella aurantiaca DW4/3-1]
MPPGDTRCFRTGRKAASGPGLPSRRQRSGSGRKRCMDCPFGSVSRRWITDAPGGDHSMKSKRASSAVRGVQAVWSLALLAGCGDDGLTQGQAFSSPEGWVLGDPYANAIGPGTSSPVLGADSALGGPDEQSAIVLGLLNTALVLDMGEGEEGTGDLSVYYSGVSIGIVTHVDFLRTDGSLISSGLLHLAKIRGGKQVTDVAYSAAPTPYRYVRLRGLLAVPYAVDAVEAASIVTQGAEG